MNENQRWNRYLGRAAVVATICAIAGPLFAETSSGGPRLLRQRDVPIVITSPGSYRLATNLVVSDPTTTAVFIKANDVSLDLDGFTIQGPEIGPSGSGSGVNTDVRSNVLVRNGVVRGFFDPAAACVHLPGHSNRVQDLRVERCPQQAIFVGPGGIISTNQVAFSGAGVSADRGAAVVGNTLYGNSNIAVFSNQGGLIIRDNSCRENNVCIAASTSGNHIDSNTITGNAVGLDLSGGAGNFFARNFLQGNTTAVAGASDDVDGAAVDAALSNVVVP